MNPTLNIEFNFDQILSLVRKLPNSQKLILTKELESELLGSEFTKLLAVFKNEEIDLDVVDIEVESVRQELYEKNIL